MKKAFNFLLIGVFCVALTTQCKKNDDDPNQNQPVKYCNHASEN